MCRGYKDMFDEYALTELVGHFTNDCSTFNLSTEDGKVSLFTNTLDPCTVCKLNVDDEGEGLECYICAQWFHNQCADSPLDGTTYAALSSTPDFVRTCCPMNNLGVCIDFHIV
jgi:hypothetical protein